MVKFEVGKIYWTWSAGDQDCIFKMKVIKRTEKTITADCGFFGVRKFRVSDQFNEGVEHAKFDRYSMAPVFNAKRFK